MDDEYSYDEYQTPTDKFCDTVYALNQRFCITSFTQEPVRFFAFVDVLTEDTKE
jgi:hypothetical protein